MGRTYDEKCSSANVYFFCRNLCLNAVRSVLVLFGGTFSQLFKSLKYFCQFLQAKRQNYFADLSLLRASFSAALSIGDFYWNTMHNILCSVYQPCVFLDDIIFMPLLCSSCVFRLQKCEYFANLVHKRALLVSRIYFVLFCITVCNVVFTSCYFDVRIQAELAATDAVC